MPGRQSAPALRVDNFSWRPHGRIKPALHEISLALDPGERVLLVGPSGSGKSTLLRAMAGLLDASLGKGQGDVSLAGESPTARPGRVGLLLQDPMDAVVAEHVGRDTAFGPENRRRPVSAIHERVAESLAAVEFPYGADHLSLALSGGEMQRLSLAGALALDPEILLLDEPTAMLDSRSAATVREAVGRASEERQLTLVVVEHRLDGWVDLCERIVVLDGRGQVLVDGPTKVVLHDHLDALLEAGIWVPGQTPPQPEQINWKINWKDDSPRLTRGPLAQGPAAEPRVDPMMTLRNVSIPSPAGGSPLMTGEDLNVNPGQALAITGPSGAGKSTMLQTMAGFVDPGEGELLINHQGRLTPISELARRSRDLARSMAWLPQHVDQFLSQKNVEEEVLATSEVLFADEPDQLDAAHARADRVMTALGIDHLRDADPHQLSGGEQRRLALAAVVVHGPSVVLMDEPTVGQDRQTWAAVVGVINALHHEGTAVLIATHDSELITAGGLQVAVDLAGRPQPDPELARAPGAGPFAPDYSIREVFQPDSPLAGLCNPLALIIIALGAAIGSFVVTDWRVGAVTLAAAALLSPLAVRKVRPALMRLIPVGLAAVTVAWSTLLFSDRGFLAPEAVPVAAAEFFRIGCLVIPGALLVGVVRPSTLGDALAQRCHLPHRPVVAATSSLLRLQQMFVLWRQLSNVRRIRGLHPGGSILGRIRHASSMTFALLVSTLRSAQQMALSMDARGFAGAKKRTFAVPSRWRKRDWLCCVVALALLLLPAVLMVNLG